MDQLTKSLLAALKHLSSAVELIDGHHPQIAVNDGYDCEICVALFESHEAIAKAEMQP